MEEEFVEPLIGSFSPKQIAARMSINGAGIIYGGLSTKYMGGNEYLVPVAGSEHFESHSLYFFFISEDLTVLFRLLINHINTHAKTVELNLAYFRYERINASPA